MIKRLKELVDAVHLEVYRAADKYPPMNSLHEGYAVLLEEVDELWDETKKKQGARNMKNVRKECIQVAAMAIRIAFDVTEDK